MGKNSRNRKQEIEKKKKQKNIILTSLVVCFVLVGVLIFNGVNNETNVYADGIEITKSDVEKDGVKFYSYKIDGKDLEVVAVESVDGSIRTAFNTCQVCYSSGKGYYKVQDSNLVCQNCGNVFSFEDVEVTRGGCNPVPITSEEKTEDNTKIVISDEYIRENVKLFNTWK